MREHCEAQQIRGYRTAKRKMRPNESLQRTRAAPRPSPLSSNPLGAAVKRMGQVFRAELMRINVAAIACLLVASAACMKVPELTHDDVKTLISQSGAFQGPIDPGVIFVDTNFRPGPNTKREIIRLEGVAVKEDGPFGIAGKTATAAFTWRWTEGPFAGRVMRSIAKLNSSGGAWHVYEDLLKQSLYAAERGESQD